MKLSDVLELDDSIKKNREGLEEKICPFGKTNLLTQIHLKEYH